MSVKKEILLRAGIVYVFFLLLAFAIIGRILYIQFVEGDELRSKVKDLTLKYLTIEPYRGDILAHDGRLLATSIPSYEIRMDMRAKGLTNSAFLNNVDSLSLCMSKLFKDKSKQEYKRDLMSAYRAGKRFHLVKRKVDYLHLKAVNKFPLFRLGRNKSGMVTMQENIRIQPHRTLASRTIGYTTKGQTHVGMEGNFEPFLKGVQGVRLMQRLAGGAWMPVNDENEVEPKDGNDVVSTIDVNIQDVAEQALRKQLEKHNAHHGCAILMEVNTGEIKAIANLGKDGKGGYAEIFNYAIGESAEPGSTFKLASMIAALEDGFIDLEDTVNTFDGTVEYYGKKLRDAEDKGLGKITIQEAFEHSSNVGISWIVNKYYQKHPKQFVDHLYSMKLNEPLNLDIKGEGKPEIKYPGDKYWSGISLPMMSIGYEVRLAPIHLLSFYNAIANDGTMVKPRFVKQVSYHGEEIKKYDTEVIKSSICSHSTLKKVHRILEGVVENGTAKNLKNDIYKIAGKTGTAQIAKLKRGYKTVDGTSYQASFVGYFPADNPKYSCIVVVNSPSNSVYYGNVVAGPVFKEIADKVFATNMEMQPILKHHGEPADIPYSKTGYKEDLEYVFNKLDIEVKDDNIKSAWVTTEKVDDKIKFNNRIIINKLVPNVVDMGLKDALFLLENAGLRVLVHGRGKVTRQSMQPGMKVKPGSTIVLNMSMG